MVDLSNALRIEALLRLVTSPQAIFRDEVQAHPYDSIMDVLRFRLPKGAKLFSKGYSQIANKSMDQLAAERYDIECLINDLGEIINKGE